jgi:hypothetical protein
VLLKSATMTERDQNTAYFVTFCIEQYKMHIGAAGQEVMDLFDRYGVVRYLVDNYDVLHTQGWQWLVADLDDYIAKRREEEKR